MKRFLIALLCSTIVMVILGVVNIGLEERLSWVIPEFLVGWFSCAVFIFTLERDKLWN